MNHSSGTLYVVATPIGNRADISFRAIETLKKCDLIAAEDTRHSGPLLAHYDITTPMWAYHDHSSEADGAKLIDQLLSGKNIALISDAGTPLISDPGYRIVKQAKAQNIKVVAIPGASAVVAALSIAGLPTDTFYFQGFLPAKKAAKSQCLNELLAMHTTTVFYESCHRIADTISMLNDIMFTNTSGVQRTVVVAREITKQFETVLSGSAGEILETLNADHNQTKGEFVVMIAPDERQDLLDQALQQGISFVEILTQELPLKQAVSLAAKLSGCKKNALYKLALNSEASTK